MTPHENTARQLGHESSCFGAMSAARGPLLCCTAALLHCCTCSPRLLKKAKQWVLAATQGQHDPASAANTITRRTTTTPHGPRPPPDTLPANRASACATPSSTAHWSRQPVSEPGDLALSAKHPDPRSAHLVLAALITFLAYFMLRAGYS